MENVSQLWEKAGVPGGKTAKLYTERSVIVVPYHESNLNLLKSELENDEAESTYYKLTKRALVSTC